MTADDNPLPSVTRTVVLDALLHGDARTERVEVRRICMPAGTKAGLHVHNCPTLGNIVAGSVLFQVEGEPESVLGPGDVFFEPEGARIAHFDALDADVTFLAYFLLTDGQEPGMDMLGN